ncbi:hypothetical protein [Inhella proteolytica]|uniref:Uncharacterized protein n=1 Tax=Inhella proteolytica TaxID=2795029 RepID=A0A931NIC1_9BURK|nr:hypothetical protein [Inhella proteolytica]MBH9578688.1 hypothetical protein [Inhella proteolytica]
MALDTLVWTYLLAGLLGSNALALRAFHLGPKRMARRWGSFGLAAVGWSLLPMLLDGSAAIAQQPWHAAGAMAALFVVSALPSYFWVLMGGAEREAA